MGVMKNIKKRKMRYVAQSLFLVLLFPSLATSQSYIASGETQIRIIDSYNQANGDVVFTLASPIAQCYGYWLAKTDVGFNASVSVILSAYQAKNKVLVYGLPGQLWTGSAKPYCKLYSIELH